MGEFSDMSDELFTEARLVPKSKAFLRTCVWWKIAFPGVIVNHPCEIWGYDDSTMLIGVVTAYQHAREETTYMWFNEEELVDNDPGACLLVVEEPGIYQCIVKFGNVSEVSNPISIISVTEATGISAPKPEA